MNEHNIKLEKLSNQIKLQSQKFSKIEKETKTELESNFDLFLEAHTNFVKTVAVTTDSKYIVSGSYDCTIRIWNFQEKRQETVLRGHTDCVSCVVITSDNNFIISGSYDYSIRIWNLLERRQETVIEGHDDVVKA